MPILSKGCKPDKFQLHKSLKVSFTNNQGLCLIFFDCESLLESNSPEILALCETNLDNSIDSGNFSVRGYLPLIQKDSTTHMHVLRSVYPPFLLGGGGGGLSLLPNFQKAGLDKTSVFRGSDFFQGEGRGGGVVIFQQKIN